MGKYEPATRWVKYHPAFTDDQGTFVDKDHPFDDPNKCLSFVDTKNLEEANRLSPGAVPDTGWFVMEVKYAMKAFCRPPLPEQTASIHQVKSIAVVKNKRIVISRQKQKQMKEAKK